MIDINELLDTASREYYEAEEELREHIYVQADNYPGDEYWAGRVAAAHATLEGFDAEIWLLVWLKGEPADIAGSDPSEAEAAAAAIAAAYNAPAPN